MDLGVQENDKRRFIAGVVQTHSDHPSRRMTLAYTVLRTFQGIQAKQNTAYENC